MRWHPVVGADHRSFLVNGTELAVAIVPHTNHRFQLCEVRCYSADGGEQVPDRFIAVRDAESVSDAEVRDRVRPRVVARFGEIDEALAYCRAQEEANGLARLSQAA